jgi:hypothetical protein
MPFIEISKPVAPYIRVARPVKPRAGATPSPSVPGKRVVAYVP